MIVTVLICLGVVSGFISGWVLKQLSLIHRLDNLQQRWQARYKKISKQRSSYLLQSSSLDSQLLKLKNQLMSVKKKSKQLRAGYQFDSNKALIEISRMREEIECKDVKIKQAREKEIVMQKQIDTDRPMLDDLKNRYYSIKTEVERLRITTQVQQLTIERNNTRKKVIVSTGRSNVIQLERVKPDDLKLIHGIGPTIEKTLNHAGIFSFIQMMKLSSDKVEQIESRFSLKANARWESWIKQARVLVAENSAISAEQK